MEESNRRKEFHPGEMYFLPVVWKVRNDLVLRLLCAGANPGAAGVRHGCGWFRRIDAQEVGELICVG